MERSPRKTKDKDINDIFDFVFGNAMGSPIIFSATPTLAQMKANTWGLYGTTLYIKFGNATGISIAGTALA